MNPLPNTPVTPEKGSQHISLAELKSIMSDLQSQGKKETHLNKYTRLVVLLFALSVIGNFGMIWTS